MEQLIDKGADINARNVNFETPLFYAARKNYPAAVRLLLQRGANSELKDKDGDRAFDHAADKRTIDSFDWQVVQSSSSIEISAGEKVSCVAGMPAHFSHELLLRCIKYLNAKDVCRAACVSGKWHRGT